ncbi:MAG: GNAT family N-acetyltransferase [Acidimicrobiales bacterium]
MKVQQVQLTDRAVEPLLAGLAFEYSQRYSVAISAAELAASVAEDFAEPDGVFLVVLDETGSTVAGAGIRRWSIDTCEVKRMWTHPKWRRQGLAVAVLDELERAAVFLGYARIRLVTGPAQPEAQALYRRRGYREVGLDRDWGGLAFEGDIAPRS